MLSPNLERLQSGSAQGAGIGSCRVADFMLKVGVKMSVQGT